MTASNSEIIGGVDTYILYAAESTYGTAVTPTTMFGGLIQSANFDMDRANTEVAGFAGTGVGDGRITAKYVPGTVSVKGNVEFKAQRFDWLAYLLLGTVTGTGAVATPFVYPIGTAVKSMTLSEELDNLGVDSKRVFAGTVINSASIKCSVGECVSCTVETLGGKLAATTTVDSKTAQITDDLYIFSGGTIEMPDSTSIGNVIDSVEISINNNFEILYGFNQEAQYARPKKLNITIKFTTKYLDDDQLTRLMGSSTAITSQTATTLTIKFTRATAGVQYVKFAFTNVVLNKISDSHNLNEFVVEDVESLAAGLTVTEVQS